MANMMMTVRALGAATTLLAVAPVSAQAHDPLEPYFGNTFVSLHDEGTQYIVY